MLMIFRKFKSQSIRRRFLRSALFAACLLTAGFAQPAYAQQRDQAKERELIAVLTNEDAPEAEKAITCKQLALHGGPEAVPALAPLLTNEHLASWARIALEAIPGPEAAAALREAAGKLEGRLLIGTLNSIGVRRDADSAGALLKHLSNDDAQAAAAAALALGRIGGDAAEKALRENLTKGPAEVRSAAAEGCILCAERHLAAGEDSVAIDIYDEVRDADLPKPRVLEATRGAILARKSDGLPLLREQLHSDDLALKRIGLMVARELAGEEVTLALADEAKKGDAELAALLLFALADRGDRAALPAVLEIAKSGQSKAQIAVAQVLLKMGDASSVPALIEMALQKDKDVADAARGTLAEMSGQEIDRAVTSRLASANGPTLVVLIETVGQRRIEAVDALRKAAESRDASVRHAAIAALGETVGPNDLKLLIARVTNSQNAADDAVALQALRAAAVRMPDREACAAQLVSAMNGQSTAVKDHILEILGEVGGSNALQAMRAAAIGSDRDLRDTASRLLGSWFDVEAGPVLLELAQMPNNEFAVRELRGYIRLARQFVMPDAQRADMCRKAMRATNRVPEQKLVLEVMERYPSPEMLSAAVEAQPVAELKDDARRVALTIASKLAPGTNVEQLLSKLSQEPVKIEIVKAQYGSGSMQKDVTDILRRQVRNLPLISLPGGGSYNAAFGGDPAPGTKKELRIQYRINGEPREAFFAENAVILLK
ncbi:MAG: HEAT repeat domain-containing protein [Aureliella sp.]